MMTLHYKKALIVLCILVCVYLAFFNAKKGAVRLDPNVTNKPKEKDVKEDFFDFDDEKAPTLTNIQQSDSQCTLIEASPGQMETRNILPKLNFNADWVERREFWNDKLEKRYQRRRNTTWEKVPLKVIVMPHSHNDAGWLKTLEEYFNDQTKHILDNAVDKLTKYKDMTFIWTEIVFLSMWYETAHDARKANFHQLLAEGRFEIPTGGWVMTDEANVDIFGMWHQLTQGHQWLLHNLNITSRTSWSCDPFGHGSTLPYLLKASGVDLGMVIMRIHYAWKEWFAIEQQGDFFWHQPWDKKGKHDILCHNFPYDIYSIKGSCGPHPQICLQFNFRHVPGDFSEYTSRYEPITPENLKRKAELLLTQYGKTGSLFPHNVVLVPLGDDFNYVNEVEWDQQYTNYKQLMDFINQGNYNAHVSFGTLKDYFIAVKERMSQFDTLSGDFHVYSDIFSSGIPAYWSGFFSTRPYMKRLSRDLGDQLRQTEILYTYSLNLARKKKNDQIIKKFKEIYSDLEKARESLALFQHHDAITGTSKQYVMHDYGLKLFHSLTKCKEIKKMAFQYLMGLERPEVVTLREDFDRPGYHTLPMPLAINLRMGDNVIIVFNPLAQDQEQVISVFLEDSEFCITDSQGNSIPYQTSPTWSTANFFKVDTNFLEVSFMAKLPALSLTKFHVEKCQPKEREQTEVYCSSCPHSTDLKSPFTLSPIPEGVIQIQNSEMVLLFNESTRLLSSIFNKRTKKKMTIDLNFSAYPTAQFQSGAYLFKPDPRMSENVQVFGIEDLKDVVIVSGPVFSEVTLAFESGVSPQNPGSFVHTVRLYHTTDGIQNKAVYIENNFNFGPAENHNDIDLFMRMKTGIKNGVKATEFYTDSSGLQMQRRTIVPENGGIEGNIYPITSGAFIEDNNGRVTLLVDHAQAATSWKQGWLEVIVDRRATFDDARGMGEGVLDNQETMHRYWLLFEPKAEAQNTLEKGESRLVLQSQLATRLSRILENKITHFIGQNPNSFKDQVKLIPNSLDCDIHLLNLRTLEHPDLVNSQPSEAALVVFHKQTSDCLVNSVSHCHAEPSKKQVFTLNDIEVTRIEKTAITGVHVAHEVQEIVPEDSVDPMTLEAFKLTFSS